LKKKRRHTNEIPEVRGGKMSDTIMFVLGIAMFSVGIALSETISYSWALGLVGFMWLFDIYLRQNYGLSYVKKEAH